MQYSTWLPVAETGKSFSPTVKRKRRAVNRPPLHTFPLEPESGSGLLGFCVVLLFDIDLAARHHARFVGQRKQYRVDQIFVIKAKAGYAGHAGIRVTVLQSQITYLRLDHTYRPAEIRNNLPDGSCTWSPFLRVGKRRGYGIVRNEKQILIILTEKETLVSIVEAEHAFHGLVVAEDAALILRVHCLRSGSRCCLCGVFRRVFFHDPRTLGANCRSHKSR